MASTKASIKYHSETCTGITERYALPTMHQIRRDKCLRAVERPPPYSAVCRPLLEPETKKCEIPIITTFNDLMVFEKPLNCQQLSYIKLSSIIITLHTRAMIFNGNSEIKKLAGQTCKKAPHRDSPHLRTSVYNATTTSTATMIFVITQLARERRRSFFSAPCYVALLPAA